MLSESLLSFVRPILDNCLNQFPLTCKKCGKVYQSFKQYVKETAPVGAPGAFDGETDPIGVLSYANCPCKSTLTLQCEDMTGKMHRMFFAAVTKEAAQTGRPEAAVLQELQQVVRKAATGKTDR